MNGTIQNRPGPRSPTNRPNRRTTARSYCCAIRGAGISTSPTSAITASGTGLPVAFHPTSPSTIAATRMAIATTFSLGSFSLSRSPDSSERRRNVAETMMDSFVDAKSAALLRGREFRACRPVLLEHRHDVVERESGRVGVGEQARHERAKPPVVLAPGARLFGRRADERADAAPRLDDAGPFELGVDARDGVRVDPQFDGQLSDGRQLIAVGEASGRDGGAQRALQLRVNRGSIVTIAIVCVTTCTSLLGQSSSTKKAARGPGRCSFCAAALRRYSPATFFSSFRSVSILPAPSTTDVSGFSATRTGRPVSSRS